MNAPVAELIEYILGAVCKGHRAVLECIVAEIMRRKTVESAGGQIVPLQSGLSQLGGKLSWLT